MLCTKPFSKFALIFWQYLIKVIFKLIMHATFMHIIFFFVSWFLFIDWFEICIFSSSEKTLLFTAFLKLSEIKYEKRSLISFIIFVGISTCWVVFDVSKLFMILLMNSGLIKSNEKLLVVSMFSRITYILGWFWYFSMAFLIATASLSEEIFVRPSIPRFLDNVSKIFAENFYFLLYFQLKQFYYF